MLDSKGSLVNA